VQRIGPVVLSVAVSPSGTIGTALRRAVGMMIADYNMINMPTFAFRVFGVCVDLARNSQATLAMMDRVRKAALAETPVSLPAIATVCWRSCGTHADAGSSHHRLYAIKSRDEVDAVSTAINDAFSQTEEAASDDLDSGTYIALIRLHGDVVKHLSDRSQAGCRAWSRNNYSRVMPALRMAQRAILATRRAFRSD